MDARLVGARLVMAHGPRWHDQEDTWAPAENLTTQKAKSERPTMYIGRRCSSGSTECTDLALVQRQLVKHLEGGFGPPGFGPNMEQSPYWATCVDG